MNNGFYKVNSDGTINYVSVVFSSPSGTYLVANESQYNYPIDGAWYYYASVDNFIASLTTIQVTSVLNALSQPLNSLFPNTSASVLISNLSLTDTQQLNLLKLIVYSVDII